MKSIVFIAGTLFLKASVVLAHDEQTCLVTAKTDNPYINLKTENGGPTNKIWFRGFGIETDATDDFNPLIEEEEKRANALTSFMDHVLIHNPQLMERYFLTFAIQYALDNPTTLVNGAPTNYYTAYTADLVDRLGAGGIETDAYDQFDWISESAKKSIKYDIQTAVSELFGNLLNDILNDSQPLVNVLPMMKTLEGYQPQVNDFGRRFGMVDSVNPVLDNAVKTLQDIVDMSGTSNRRRLDADAAVAKTAAIKNIQKSLTARILKRLDDGQSMVEVARKMKAIEGMQPQINDMNNRTAVIPELNRELSWIGMTLEKGIDVRGMGKKRRRLSEDENINNPSPSANIMEDVGKYIKDAEKEIQGIYGKKLRATAAIAKTTDIKNIQKSLTAQILKRLDDGAPLVEVYRKMKAIEGLQPQINDMERRLNIIQSVEPVLDNANRHLKTLTDVNGMGKKRRLSGDELEMAFSSFIDEEKEQEQRKGNYETRWQLTKELAAIPQKMKAIYGMQPQMADLERRLGILQSVGPVLDNAIGTLEEIVDERRLGFAQSAVFGEAIDHLEELVDGQNVKDVSGIGKRRRLDNENDPDKNMILVIVNAMVDSLKVLYRRTLSQHPVDIDSSSETNDVSPVKDGIDEYYFGASPPHGHKDVSATIQDGEHGEKENIAFCKKPKSGVINYVFSEDVNVVVHGGSALQRAFVGKRMRHISRLQQKVKNMERRLGILQSVEPILEIVIKHLQKIVDVRGIPQRRLSSNKSINTLLMHTTPLIKSESEKYSALEELANNMKALERMQPQINELERRLGILQSVEPVLENAIKTLQKVVDVRGMGKK